MMANVHLGYLLHVLVEIPAAINFFRFPSRQLGARTPHAHAVIRQYALLLISSIIIALIFVRRPEDELSGQVAGALALYHLGPAVRSASRIWGYVLHPCTVDRGISTFFEPVLHLIVHTVTGKALASSCWTSYLFPNTSTIDAW